MTPILKTNIIMALSFKPVQPLLYVTPYMFKMPVNLNAQVVFQNTDINSY